MISLKPLNYIDINHYAYVERLELIQGNSGTCYVQIVNIDPVTTSPSGAALFGGIFAQNQVVASPSRWVPAAGATVQLVFPRSMSITPTPANQDVTVSMTVVDSRDASIYKFDLTASNIDKIVSGGVKLLITEGGVTKTYPVDAFVNRRTNLPGA